MDVIISVLQPHVECTGMIETKYGQMTEADFKIFSQSVETNQQRLMTNAYYPFDLESEEAIYRKCY